MSNFPFQSSFVELIVIPVVFSALSLRVSVLLHFLQYLFSFVRIVLRCRARCTR